MSVIRLNLNKMDCSGTELIEHDTTAEDLGSREMMIRTWTEDGPVEIIISVNMLGGICDRLSEYLRKTRRR